MDKAAAFVTSWMAYTAVTAIVFGVCVGCSHRMPDGVLDKARSWCVVVTFPHGFLTSMFGTQLVSLALQLFTKEQPPRQPVSTWTVAVSALTWFLVAYKVCGAPGRRHEITGKRCDDDIQQDDDDENIENGNKSDKYVSVVAV